MLAENAAVLLGCETAKTRNHGNPEHKGERDVPDDLEMPAGREESALEKQHAANDPIYCLETAGEMAEWLKAAVC
jgi:hypothetical protein